MTQDMTPEYRSLMLHAELSQRMLLARDAAMVQDGQQMQNWLGQARAQYEQYLTELIKICERLPR